MKFRSTLSESRSAPQIDHASRLLAMGSCFADRIGEKLRIHKFPIEINPLGICYNPISLFRQLSWMLGKENFSEPMYQESHDRWHSFDLHSRWSEASKGALLSKLKEAREHLGAYLQETDCLMLTFGTARVYRRKDTGDIVANNYAYPAGFFTRELLSSAFMLEQSEALLQDLSAHNPGLQILISLSPVRHIRDGLEENAVSKAHLLILCEELAARNTHVHYFPAYEIMMDDLRDYRFYKADLIHPNDQAEAYIWEFFKQRHVTEASLALLEKISHILKDLNHKPFNPSSAAHQKFLQALRKKIAELPPEIDFEEEKRGGKRE